MMPRKKRESSGIKPRKFRVYWEGLSLREAAAVEKVTTAALAQRLSRAREMIRQCIQTQAREES